MKPSVRPPSGKVATSSVATKNTGSSVGLSSGKPISKVENKPPNKPETKTGIQKVSSYGQLKPNTGAISTSSKQIPKPGKIVPSYNNPELKLKSNIPTSNSNKPGLNPKALVSNIQKIENNSHYFQKREHVEKQPLIKQQTQLPIKKSVGSVVSSSRLAQGVQQHLEGCKQCGRTFNQKALARHEKICKKVFTQKRKEFNSAKQRLISKQQVTMLKKNKLSNNQIQNNLQKINNIPKWKQESLAFRAAMKNSRGQGLSANEALQFKQQIGPKLVPCKFCSKKFAEETHAKHVVFCEKKAKELAMLNKKKK